MSTAPLLQRISVYGLGLASVLVLTKFLSSSDFGKFSIIQSSLEFGAIWTTLGTQAYYTNRAIHSGRFSRISDIFLTIGFGLPLGGAVFLFFSRDVLEYTSPTIFSSQIFFISLLAMAAFSQLNLYEQRIFDNSSLLNIDGAVRAGSLIIFISLLSLEEKNIDWQKAAICTVPGYALMIVASLIYRNRHPKRNEFTARIKEEFSMLLHAVPQFLIKKFDLLFIGMFSSSEYVAAFKISFLISEVPFQFFLAYLNRYIVDFSSQPAKIPKAIARFIVIVIGSEIFILISYFASQHALRQDLLTVIPALAPYFALRCLSALHESLATAQGQMTDLKICSVASASIKFLLLYACLGRKIIPIEMAYILSGLIELSIWEVASKIRRDKFVTPSIFRGTF